MSTAEGLAIILVGLCVAFFGVVLSASHYLASWLFVAFLFPLLVWVQWRLISLSPPWKKLMILALYQLPLAIPSSIRTDIAIDRWSAADWWRAGVMAEIALCIAFLVGMALGMWKAASREAPPPIEPNGAQA